MKLKINSVSKNYGNTLDGTKVDCLESWIYGKFKDGTEIKIFDMNCMLPKECKDQEIEDLPPHAHLDGIY